jgi:hypothetical protein
MMPGAGARADTVPDIPIVLFRKSL